MSRRATAALPAMALAAAMLAPVPGSGAPSGAEHVRLFADERLDLEASAAQNPVNFFIMHGSPPKLLFPVKQGPFKNVASWQIRIFNSDAKTVGFIQGTGAPRSPIIPWSGLSDSGEPLPDGFYEAQLIWNDSQGVHTTLPRKVSLLTPEPLRGLVRFQIKLDYTDEGLVVRVPEILFFNRGQALIREEALPALQAIVVFLRSSPDNKVSVRGYTDSTGSRQSNLDLSRARARAVLTFLTDNGIDSQRLTYEGMGPARPIAPNSTEAGRAKNRRVDVVVLKTKQ